MKKKILAAVILIALMAFGSLLIERLQVYSESQAGQSRSIFPKKALIKTPTKQKTEYRYVQY